MHHGEALALLCTLPDASVDAVICDPPYSSGGMFRGDRAKDTGSKYTQTSTTRRVRESDDVEAKSANRSFGGDSRDQRSYLAWCTVWLDEALRVCRPDGFLACFTDWRQLPVTTDAVQCGGWIWRGVITWDKGGGCRPLLGGFSSQAEFVVWGTPGSMAARSEFPCGPGVIHAPHDRGDRYHQTGKPVALLREIVRLVREGGVVLDPFAGSGTTGAACLQSGRRFIGSELDAEYCEVARARLQAEAAGVSLRDARAGQAGLFGGDS